VRFAYVSILRVEEKRMCALFKSCQILGKRRETSCGTCVKQGFSESAILIDFNKNRHKITLKSLPRSNITLE
jgi:hypothetical protein